MSNEEEKSPIVEPEGQIYEPTTTTASKVQSWWDKWNFCVICVVVLIGVPILAILLYLLFGVMATGKIHGVKYYKHWNYDTLGAREWTPVTCRYGKKQSPISLSRRFAEKLEVRSELNFADYKNTFHATARNTEYGVQILIRPEDASSIMGGGLVGEYRLRHIRFHWSQNDSAGSEHTIDGKSYPLEIQLVHVRNGYSWYSALTQPDGIAIVSVFGEMDDRVRDMPTTAYLERTLLELERDGSEAKVLVTPEHFLPHDRNSWFRYSGSLTSPDCNEAVVWTIMTEPMKVRRSLLHGLRNIRGFDEERIKMNHRPIQPLNDRTVHLKSSNQ